MMFSLSEFVYHEKLVGSSQRCDVLLLYVLSYLCHPMTKDVLP